MYGGVYSFIIVGWCGGAYQAIKISMYRGFYLNITLGW
jgi:hypothetical protein